MEKFNITFKWKDDDGDFRSQHLHVYYIPRIGDMVNLGYHNARVKDVIHDLSSMWSSQNITIELEDC